MSALQRLGIPNEWTAPAAGSSGAQAQTRDAFAFKWSKQDTYDAAHVQEAMRNWLLERYCGGDPARVDAWLAGDKKLIIDVGCGAGLSAMLLFGNHLRDHDYLGIDISDAVHVARERFQQAGYRGDFLCSDLLEAPIRDESVDIIFSEGVLHHTDSTERALKHLARKLVRGGLFLFYVYARKARIREFTDDCIRESLRDMSDAEAWKALEPLTRLGVALGELNVEIEIPEAIPYLGIPSGKMDLQRFIYWNICKMYYRPGYSLDELNHINFDWFRPLNCHRQTPHEVRQWCHEASLGIEWMDIQEAGITVVAKRL
ncbi:MAG: class I SAM-dependent methyltransferase [Chloroflexi bacterium]|nr:class I SAM-dependent methyltransferase [Chloroflexota bacterium]MBV9894533.1 class I SAM-dependent methyltransferase [Chloroflexota bacterium]